MSYFSMLQNYLEGGETKLVWLFSSTIYRLLVSCVDTVVQQMKLSNGFVIAS